MVAFTNEAITELIRVLRSEGFSFSHVFHKKDKSLPKGVARKGAKFLARIAGGKTKYVPSAEVARDVQSQAAEEIESEAEASADRKSVASCGEIEGDEPHTTDGEAHVELSADEARPSDVSLSPGIDESPSRRQAFVFASWRAKP